MFEHTTVSNPTAADNAAGIATPRATSNSAVTASSADTGADGKSQTETALARQRTISDQIDLSIEANERIENALGEFQRPVFEINTAPLEAFNALKPALDEAQARMNRDAFIILSMMGVPPAKARAIANAMTGGDPAELKTVGANGAKGEISTQELSINIAQGNSVVNLGQVSVNSRSVEIDFSAIETRFSSLTGSADISISEFHAHIELIRIEISQMFQQDPLILDLDGNGVDITSVMAGTRFDIDGNGTLDQTAWVSGGDALLALDRNGDGKINDGTELFGDQNGAKDGFAELAKYDDNHDGQIDENDAVFSSLVLLRADGSQTDLANEGIKSISLAMITPLDERLMGGDLVAKSGFTRADGSHGMVGEVLFDVQA
ncbi:MULTISPECIES: hypothetical protein [unclassified Thalassospira]|uniref:hypothetical protein n=1 Tax=unclassified Thalassospira TaxID=2648997 RepID=UPI0025F7DDB4|nr:MULTISPECIES: hypothetical protein [unclassified Thalassospira]|tara:strand:+ start:11822 stop:12955 length:1134 start_codon:yes stop_codon:yes gene_type:complete